MGSPLTSELRASRERVKPLSTTGFVLLGVGAVSVGAGLLWRARVARRTDVQLALNRATLVHTF